MRRGAPRDPLTIWRCESAESRSESFTEPARRKKSPRRTRRARNAAAMAGMGRGWGGAERIGTALPAAAVLRPLQSLPLSVPLSLPLPSPQLGMQRCRCRAAAALLLPALLEHRLTAARCSVGPQEREKRRPGPPCMLGSAAPGPARAAALRCAGRIQRFRRDVQELLESSAERKEFSLCLRRTPSFSRAEAQVGAGCSFCAEEQNHRSVCLLPSRGAAGLRSPGSAGCAGSGAALPPGCASSPQ